MARKRKKVVNNRDNQAAGDSRFSVLTEAEDTYNPFKDLKKEQVVSKAKNKPQNKSLNKSKKKQTNIMAENFGDDVSFGDILSSWETDRSLKNVSKKNNKTQKKRESEDFATVFAQWEKEKGIAPKKPKTPPKKSKDYKPSKQFGDILNEFEGKKVNTKIENINTKTEKTEEVKKQNKIKQVEEVITGDYKVIAQSNNSKINNKEDRKSFISKKQKKNKSVIKQDLKNEITKEKIDKKENKLIEQKIEVQKNKIENKDSIKDEVPSNETDKKGVSWSVGEKLSKKYKEDKKEIVEENKSIEEKEEKKTFKRKDYNKKKKSNKNFSEKTKEENLPPKWDFSDIYSFWSKNNNEDESIDKAKKQKDKKESKGISISYLHSMSPEAELDLHGLTSDVAMFKTKEFLINSRNSGMKKVSIITGKGNHSENGKSILQDVVLSQIRLSGIVREAYHPKNIYGGTGAVWVIFKSISDKKIYF